MSEKVWQVKTDGKDHFVGYKAGFESGEVFIDGSKVDAKGSSTMGVLMEMSFKIEGKKARLQRRRLLDEDWELVYGGKVCAPAA